MSPMTPKELPTRFDRIEHAVHERDRGIFDTAATALKAGDEMLDEVSRRRTRRRPSALSHAPGFTSTSAAAIVVDAGNTFCADAVEAAAAIHAAVAVIIFRRETLMTPLPQRTVAESHELTVAKRMPAARAYVRRATATSAVR